MNKWAKMAYDQEWLDQQPSDVWEVVTALKQQLILLHETSITIDWDQGEECIYCEGNCPNEPDDSKDLCDDYKVDIKGYYAEQLQS